MNQGQQVDMRLPIKINHSVLPKWFPVPTSFSSFIATDPRPLWSQDGRSERSRHAFSSLVSGLHVGGTWKTTFSVRHAQSNQFVVELAKQAHSAGRETYTILDVGISDGITCLELLDALQAAAEVPGIIYYATDAYTFLHISHYRGWSYIYDPLDRSVCMAVSALLVVFSNTQRAPSWLARLARLILLRAPPYPQSISGSEIDLIQPELRHRAAVDPRIQVRTWDIFTPWSEAVTEGAIDLVKVANLLNQSYFSDERICQALENLHGCLQPGGGLLLVENRKTHKNNPEDQEQWSYFERTPTGFQPTYPARPDVPSIIPLGSDITTLVAAWKSKMAA